MRRRGFCWISRALMALTAVAAPTAAFGQAARDSATADAFVIKGIVADARGPLARKKVLVSPIDTRTGSGVIIHPVVYGEPGPMINPEATSDARGAFTLTVKRSLFAEDPRCAYNCASYRSGELTLGVSDDMGNGQRRGVHKAVFIKYDVNAATVDVGRVVFAPLK